MLMYEILKKRIALFLGRHSAFSERSFTFQLTILSLIFLVFLFTASQLWQLMLRPAQGADGLFISFITIAK